MKKLPPHPTNVGKRSIHKTIDGRTVSMVIEDEIVLPQRSSRHPKSERLAMEHNDINAPMWAPEADFPGAFLSTSWS